MSDFAADLYAELDDCERVQALIVRQEAERLHLDFKQEPQREHLPRIVSKAVSGFANADGGVLVFGVAEVDKVLVDKPIREPAPFEQEINRLLSRQVAFPVEGVATRTVRCPTGGGYVIVLVPRSDLAPHRAEFDGRYYRRAGESFAPMAHYEIADLFGRRHRPNLVLSGLVRVSLSNPTTYFVDITLALTNTGRGIAKYPWLRIDSFSSSVFAFSQYELDGSGRSGLPKHSVGHIRTYEGGADHVVHALAERPITKIVGKYSAIPQASDKPALELRATLSAEGLAPFEIILFISDKQIHGCLCTPGSEGTFVAQRVP